MLLSLITGILQYVLNIPDIIRRIYFLSTLGFTVQATDKILLGHGNIKKTLLFSYDFKRTCFGGFEVKLGYIKHADEGIFVLLC